MVRVVLALGLLVAVLLVASPASAADWGAGAPSCPEDWTLSSVTFLSVDGAAGEPVSYDVWECSPASLFGALRQWEPVAAAATGLGFLLAGVFVGRAIVGADS